MTEPTPWETTDRWERIGRAIAFCIARHAGQTRKGNTVPYATHPVRMMVHLLHQLETDDPDILAACLLHDTMEDTGLDYEDVASRFSPRVAEWVAQLSADRRLPMAERHEEVVRTLEQAPWQVKLVKLCDIYDNARSIGALPQARRRAWVKRKWDLLPVLRVGLPDEYQPLADEVDQLVREAGV